jgi:protein-tyrosine phosphatase
MTLEVVFICTGNRFRSPLAEALFRRAAGELPVAVRSLGTLDLGPLPPLDGALEEAARLDLDLSAHRSSPLAGERLAEADLVLGFERMHVVTAVVDAEAPRERTFTLPELVELLARTTGPRAADPIERARLAIELAAAERPDDPRLIGLPELPDPLGKPPEVVRKIAGRIDVLTAELARALFAR